jgi:hypothetical protein
VAGWNYQLDELAQQQRVLVLRQIGKAEALLEFELTVTDADLTVSTPPVNLTSITFGEAKPPVD